MREERVSIEEIAFVSAAEKSSHVAFLIFVDITDERMIFLKKEHERTSHFRITLDQIQNICIKRENLRI